MTTATLRWTDPNTRVDGSALASAAIASISVLDTRSDGSVDFLGEVLPSVGAFTTGALDVGDHSFTVVVKDTSGHSSARSNVAAVTVGATLADPTPVADLSAVLN